MEQDQLLRPRANTSSPPPSESPEAMLLPRHGAVAPSAHALPAPSGRSWLPRLLVVAGGIYMLMMLAWSSQNLSVQTGESSIAASAETSVEQMRASSSSSDDKTQTAPYGAMDLTAILKAANHPETDEDRQAVKEQAQAKLRTQQINVEDTPAATQRVERTAELPQTSELPSRFEVQLDVDLPMELSQQREALRLAREAVLAEMQAEKDASSASSGTTTESEVPESELSAKMAKRQEAEEHALDVLMLPKNDTRKRSFKCVGWRSTGGCSPHGPREPENDFNCVKLVPFGHSGYCEVEDTETGELFRVMRRYCSSSKYDTSFRCSDATNFINFRHKANEAAEKALEPDFALPNIVENVTEEQAPRDGIVMVVYPKLIPSAYATIKTLREVLGCTLPIEIWFRRAEMNGYPNSFKPLEVLAADNETSTITFHEITDWHAVNYGTKVFAIYNSFFDRVLFLDADNVPTRDPTFLFESQEFVDTGAVFWPDFWHPTKTIFNIHSQSLVWELLDMPMANMFEQESGQVLIDRRRHSQALELVKFYAFHRPSFFDTMKLAHGDKDLFRFAWLKLNASFHMIQAAPAVAGKIINESFCGLTMVQHDAQGQVLFLHRNSHKLTGEPLRAQVDYRSRAVERSRKKGEIRQKARLEGKPIPSWSELDALVQAEETPAPTLEPAEPDGYPDSAVWTHLLSFDNAWSRSHYVIETYNADPEFPKSQNCYGQRNVSKNEYFFAQKVADLSFAGIETEIRRFAAEAVQLKQQG